MLTSLEQVSDSLIRMGILSDTVVSETTSALREAGQGADGEGLLDELLARGSLTAYQAQRLRQGRAEDLVFGNYLILSEIGAGAMGTVFKAVHRRMHRVVAVKLLKQEFSSPDKIARFQREVQAAARLNHPNAIAAYDADVCAHGYFLVMEYVEGSDLREVVQRTGPLDLAAAVDAVRQAAAGLAYAHAHGVIHRDVKPANLMRDVSGVIKIADLGLARLAAAESSDGVAEQAALTGTGSMAGTVDFMPPEQAVDTGSADERADIYSLGCTLYSLLTGKAMYEEPTLMARLLAHREKPVPSLRAAREDVPEAVDLIFQRMAAKKPADRYPSMAAALKDLEALGASAGSRRDWAPASSTVLVVDSSRLLTAIVCRFLRELGADDVHLRHSGADALEALAQMPAQVVLASVQLPDMTGVQLAQRIREDLRWSRVAIVLMTADPPLRLLDNVRRLGGVEVLRKPFDGAQLKSTITQALRTNAIVESRLANVADLHVLCVDDSSVARRRIQKVLADLGFSRFTAVADGAEAVAALERQKFDLIVADYNMPRMDGCQLVRHIRTQSGQRQVPIILCTTEFDPARLAQIYQLGVSAICNKSFEPELVRNIVVRLFK